MTSRPGGTALSKDLSLRVFSVFILSDAGSIPAASTGRAYLIPLGSWAGFVHPFFAMHPLWHAVGAFGFIFLWAFDHVGGQERASS